MSLNNEKINYYTNWIDNDNILICSNKIIV